MKPSTVKSLVVAGTVAVGVVAGSILSKIILDKVPNSQPVILWVSGALIGVGSTLIATTTLITESEEASILSTPTVIE